MGAHPGVSGVREDIDREIPELSAAGYEITTEATIVYNCIAWAAGDTSQWWDCDEDGPIDLPGCDWPEGANHGVRLDALISVFETRSYSICQDGALEEGLE